MTKQTVLFMGSPDIAVPFLAFLEKKQTSLAVFTQPDKIRGRGKKTEPTPVKAYAVEKGMPVFDLSVKTMDAYKIIQNINPDIIFVVAYGQIIPARILSCARIAPINIHFSLLPAYRGATPVNTVLLEGQSMTGTTVMKMDSGMDTGDILWQDTCGIEPHDNATSLFEKLIEKSLALLETHWKELTEGDFFAVPQSGNPSYTSLIRKESLLIDWDKPADEIHNRIRAFTALPGIKTKFRGRNLAIEHADLLERGSGNPGEIFEITKDSLSVSCARGGIRLLTVRPEGKTTMSVKAFIAGYRPRHGEVMG